MGIIDIEDMKFYAYHGCYKEEKVVGNYFTVWVRLEGDFSASAQSDDLNKALDYQKAVAIVKQEMEKSANLLEHLVNRILDALHATFTSLDKATVKVAKLSPPVAAEVGKISVTMSK